MISLVTATLGRIEPIYHLLDSLSKQTYRNFELIIVDQNSHYRIKEIVEKYSDIITIKYIRNKVSGLSLNRNIGLNLCVGDIVGFPDDDCYYSSDVLEKVANAFEMNRSISFVATDWYDSIIPGQCARCFDESEITKSMAYKMCISFNLFVRNKWNIRFDERLGVGAIFGAGEETDFLYSLMWETGLNGRFIKSSGVFHPIETNRSLDKTYNYAVGQGAVWKKDLVERNNTSVIFDMFKSITRLMMSMLKPKNVPIANATIRGYINGFYNFKCK